MFLSSGADGIEGMGSTNAKVNTESNTGAMNNSTPSQKNINKKWSYDNRNMTERRTTQNTERIKKLHRSKTLTAAFFFLPILRSD